MANEANERLMKMISETLGQARTLSLMLDRGPGGREISLAITMLQQAWHWSLEASWLLPSDQHPIQATSREEFYANWQRILDRQAEASPAKEE